MSLTRGSESLFGELHMSCYFMRVSESLAFVVRCLLPRKLALKGMGAGDERNGQYTVVLVVGVMIVVMHRWF